MTALIQALLDPRCYPHTGAAVRLIETHISWLLLTGEYAYKIKKPVDLGFVDFTTLERRRHFCAEEVRLNRRYAPDIYLDVVPITGTADAPAVDGTGPPIEYAVRMREFHQEDLLDRRLRDDRLEPADIDQLADSMSRFHAESPPCSESLPHSSTETLLADALANFAAISAAANSPAVGHRIDALERWTRAEHARLTTRFARRRAGGRIRECHGDLHLGNIALIDGRITPFDCIEFNDGFRWIDVMNELAFTAMDLAARRRDDLAHRLVNRYLESSGDYDGLEVLRFYLVYRAMVRAKIDCIHAAQAEVGQQARRRDRQDFTERLELAERLVAPKPPFLAITNGLSGSGKTHASQFALERTGAVRLRSDVERKRLHGLSAGAASGAALDEGIYAARASERTYERLVELARLVLDAGYPVIVDATFIRRTRRLEFAALAASMRLPFAILDCHADERIIEARIARRQQAASDASEAGLEVMRRQKNIAEPLDAAERSAAITIDAGDPASLPRAIERLSALGGAP